MCGIVGVIQEEPGRPVPDIGLVRELLERARGFVPFEGSAAEVIAKVSACAEAVEEANELLSGEAGLLCLAASRVDLPLLAGGLQGLEAHVSELESRLDEGHEALGDAVEDLNAPLVRLKDAVWATRRDRIQTVERTLELSGADAPDHCVAALAHLDIALGAIDRLEVRGRDSAGLVVLVRSHGLDLAEASVSELIRQRSSDRLMRSGSVRHEDGVLCFVYKAAAEIGELGDNTRALRTQIASDELLRLALSSPSARVVVLGHTRWASVGMISEPNAHPLASDLVSSPGPLVLAVLNGDIDNHADLVASSELSFPVEVTTDTKIISPLISSRLAEQGAGQAASDPAGAFRKAVSAFEGSVAIGAVSLSHPDRLLLALRGSGQALYIGVSAGLRMVASETYGLVEQTRSYIRMDGEAPASSGDPSSRGQVVELVAGGVLRRWSYDGRPLEVSEAEVQQAETTTRDIDRGAFSHFLIKEIHESPESFLRTLRGRLVGDGRRPRVVLGDDVLPEELRRRLRTGDINRIVVIGQGTAAIAGQAVAGVLSSALNPLPIRCQGMAATELSGFGLEDDMSGTLLVAISQSGTTTDTNRTVDVARGRGAAVIAIVNRRQSDLTDRADGVLYTSDGRDVEMAVPSTKAFYAQVAAGFLLTAALAAELDGAAGIDADVLRGLRELPAAMRRVLELRSTIAEIARRHVLERRDWAVVGNGANRVAAEEVRIKLSELCYKSISSDVTEDKKHIDLSAEPLILVCAAGLQGSNAEDVAKEISIYRAHKAAPIVICGEGEGAYEAALDVIRVPSVHPGLAFVLSAMAGHLFGYEAALAIDFQANALRQARAAIETVAEDVAADRAGDLRILERVRPSLLPAARAFNEGLRSGAYNGHLDASTAVRISSLFRYATGMASLDDYQAELGKIGTPDQVLTDLTEALSAGIDELTRPIDAIRHQAKTVTVGITRAEETLFGVPLVREVLEAGVARDRLTYSSLRALAALDPSVERVTGYTLYRIEGDVDGDAQIRVTDRGGISHDIPSRTDRDPRLRGTKHRVSSEREVLVTRGGDGRTLVIVPETKGSEVTGIALLHVNFAERLPADVMRSVLQGYRDRYAALRDLVLETEPTFRDDLLAEIDVDQLLIASIQALAERWRAGT